MHQILQKTIVIVLFLLGTGLLIAQSNTIYHSIQVGTFVGTSLSDFSNIKDYGYIYAEPVSENTYRVFLGGYKDLAEAELSLDKVKKSGFSGAFLSARPLDKGKQVTVVQLATKSIDDPINWARFLNLGRIHTIVDNKVIKIVSGVYPNVLAAQNRLERARSMGFADAFTKEVNSMLLHEVNAFETGGLEPSSVPVAEIATPSEPTSSEFTSKGIPSEPIPETFDFESKTIKIPATIKAEETREEFTTKGGSSSTTSVKAAPKVQIKVKTQHLATKWLQAMLKEEGQYDGVIDGYYGDATKSAYHNTIRKNYQLQKYYLLNTALEHQAKGDFRDWESMRLLEIIADDIMTGNAAPPNGQILLQMYQSPKMLETNERQLIVSWDYRFRRGLKIWAKEDPLHIELATALKITYLQTQIELEQYFMAKGLTKDASNALALKTLKIVVGTQLDRFQNL